jgi:putative endopeptidase
MKYGLAGAACLAAALISTPGFSADAILISGIQTADMDVSARPQDDLFQYANGTWLRGVAIPPDRASYGVDAMMTERSTILQRELIEAARNSTDPEARKVGNLYASFMDEARIEALGAAPLQPDLKRIAAVKRSQDLTALIAYLDRSSVPTPLGTNVSPDS